MEHHTWLTGSAILPRCDTFVGLGWPTPFADALVGLTRVARGDEAFGFNYHRARGFSWALSEAFAVPHALPESVVERAAVGRPESWLEATQEVMGLRSAYDDGVERALRCLQALTTGERDVLLVLLGEGVRSAIYERVFQRVRQATRAVR